MIPSHASYRSAVRLCLTIGGLAVLLALLQVPAQTAWAQSPTPTMPALVAPCTQCHAEETEAWQDSPHAAHTVTCESCHGPYQSGHPASEEMPLGVDSGTCHTCHSETYSQWESSLHAKVGVQCIGCHMSHSQQFRLTDEALCGSCHRDTQQAFAHSTHATAGVTCTTCHVSSLAGHVEEGITVPSHRFDVASEVCVGCHGATIHQLSSFIEANQTGNAAVSNVKNSLPELAAKVKDLERQNSSLQTTVFIGLGLGLGSGVVVGIVFTLVVGYIAQGRAKK